ncbi:MAG: response regulator [Acidobacteriaceae bacterium]
MTTRIFVVDDERTIADTLAAILRHHGYEAAPFYDAATALAACEAATPNLLISDVVMPQCSGIDLAIQIKEHWPACRILLFSGHAGTVDLLKEARQLGHTFEILSKPIHPKDLLAKLEVEMTAPPASIPKPSAASELRR